MDNFSSYETVLGHGERDHTGDIEAPKAVETAASDVEFGSGWYHDTAIVEAEQARPRLQQSTR